MRKQWQEWVMIALGVWLFISPFVLGYGGASALNAYYVGAGLVLFSVIALVKPQLWGEWVNLVLGGWLLVSAFLLTPEGGGVAQWNHVIVGVLVVVDALSAVFTQPEQTKPLPPLR